MTKLREGDLKRLVSSFLLFFCSILILLIGFGLVFYVNGSNVQFVNTPLGRVKVEIVDNVTLNDNTAEKLSNKVKITTYNQQIDLTPLVKVTQQNVMFEFSAEDKTYYFSAINKVLKQSDNDLYTTTSGTTTIDSKNALEVFRDRVNAGDSYAGSTVNLTVDIDLSSVDNWVPIGSTIIPEFKATSGGASISGLERKTFNGTFNGNGHKIENLKMTEQVACTVPLGNMYTKHDVYRSLGLFGDVCGNAKISNLWLNNVKITSTTKEHYPKSEGIKKIGSLAGSISGKTEIFNIKLTNCNITNSNTQPYESNNYELHDRGSSAGGLIGVVCRKGNEETGVLINDIDVSDTSVQVTGTNGISSCAGGIVGEIQVLETWTYSGNYQISIARFIPTVTIKNCIAKTKLNVVDNEKNHCRYVCIAGIVGRFSCGSYNYESISTVEISGCVAQIDSDSSIKITKATKSSHPTMCYDLWEYAPSGKKNNYISKLNNLMSQKMTKNYYIDSGYSYDNYSYTAKL